MEHLNLKHETKKHVLRKFILIILILLVYFFLISIKLGIKDGLLVTILTWSFFVFCTPIADAGFLVDFPIRLITKMKMVYSEIIVWCFAIILNILILKFNPLIYQKTVLLKLFHIILTNIYPYWIIIILSGLGTFLSVYFGDELLDVKFHHQREKYHKNLPKYQYIIFLFLIILILIIYHFLIEEVGLKIPLF